jgi:hypothetical protein
MTALPKKPTYQLINKESNTLLCKPYKQLARVKKIQKQFFGVCETVIRKTDFSNLEQINTILN